MSRLSRLTGVVAAALTLALPAAAHAAPSYYPSGPQTDVARSAPLAGGWQVCYQGGYNDTTPLAPILSDCDGEYLMLAGGVVGSPDYLVLAAAPRADVLFDLGNSQFGTHAANGSQWYFGTSWSWGFAGGGDSVNRQSCDTVSVNQALRLCWHTGGGNLTPGYKAGNNFSYNTLDRVVLESLDVTAIGSPDPLTFASQPLSTVSAKQTVTFTVSGPAGLTAQERELGALQIDGADADEFDVVDNTCPAVAPDGASVVCTVKIRFVPQSSGARTAQLHFANTPTQTVTLNGTGGQLPQGPEGPAGADGPAGSDGSDGTNGADGADGIGGTNGTDGIDGTNGADGTNGIDATNGTDGTDGTNGATGPRGRRGRFGAFRAGGAVSCTVTRHRAGSRAVCTFARRVKASNRVQLRDKRGKLATAAGRNGKRMVFVTKRRAEGRLYLYVTVGRQIVHRVLRAH